MLDSRSRSAERKRRGWRRRRGEQGEEARSEGGGGKGDGHKIAEGEERRTPDGEGAKAARRRNK